MIYYLSKVERLFSLRRICIDRPWRGGGEGINTPNWYVSSFFTPHCSFLILYIRVRKTYIVVTSMLNALRLQCPEESGFARRLHGNDTDATRAYSP